MPRTSANMQGMQQPLCAEPAMLPDRYGLLSIEHSMTAGAASVMSQDRLVAIAERIVAARRQGARIALAGADAPADYEEGFAIQDKVVAALASPVIGWKVMAVRQGPVILAPILQSGRVAAGGTWEVAGREPAGIELEIAFQ